MRTGREKREGRDERGEGEERRGKGGGRKKLKNKY